MKILIVEDAPDMVLGLKDNFEFEGYEVVTASDGAAGLERARSEKPDLLVLDIMLPKLSGLEVCKTLRAEGFRVRWTCLMAPVGGMRGPRCAATPATASPTNTIDASTPARVITILPPASYLLGRT